MPVQHKDKLRDIPSVDRMLREPGLAAAIETYGRSAVTDAAREVLAGWRQRIMAVGSPADSPIAAVLGPREGSLEAILCQEVETSLQSRYANTLRRVLNLTGTVIHTNLGRAALPDVAVQAVCEAAGNATALEFDLETASRGDRDVHTRELICELTGAEWATVVNNNAAATILALNTLALGREVVTSRGELVEIGGSFRIPEVITSAGCLLKEVGTTNRTHLKDYAAAINGQTACLLKVHTSNYVIRGFSNSVSIEEIAGLAKQTGLPFVVDLGSGTLLDTQHHGLPKEQTVAEVLAMGADIVTFSGDKLLGGPQAGIIAGRRDILDRINRNPLKRALRVDKLTTAALRAVLLLYKDPDRVHEQLPIYRNLLRKVDEIEALGRKLLEPTRSLLDKIAQVTLEPCHSQIGSGALPVETIPSWALCLKPVGSKGQQDGNLNNLARNLRQLPIPVIGRLHDGSLYLDLRCLEDSDLLLAQLSQLQT